MKKLLLWLVFIMSVNAIQAVDYRFKNVTDRPIYITVYGTHKGCNDIRKNIELKPGKDVWVRGLCSVIPGVSRRGAFRGAFSLTQIDIMEKENGPRVQSIEVDRPFEAYTAYEVKISLKKDYQAVFNPI